MKTQNDYLGMISYGSIKESQINDNEKVFRFREDYYWVSPFATIEMISAEMELDFDDLKDLEVIKN